MIRRRLVFFLAVIVILFSQSLFSRPVSASPAVIRTTSVSLTCSSMTIIGDLFGRVVTRGVSLGLHDVTTNSILFAGSVQAIDGNVNATITFPPVPGHLVESVGGLGTRFFTVPACPPVTWFDPGDGRLDPRPGDRLAVYCEAHDDPPHIAVWGIVNSDGFEMIEPDIADIANQWQSFDDGKGGSVSIGGQGSTFAAQWFNSSVGATGTGDFAKTVTCAG